MENKSTKANPGRPPVAHSRSEKITISLTKTEKKSLLRSANESNKPLASYIQFVVLRAMNEERSVGKRLEDLESLVKNLEKQLVEPIGYIAESCESNSVETKEVVNNINKIVKFTEFMILRTSDLIKIQVVCVKYVAMTYNCIAEHLGFKQLDIKEVIASLTGSTVK